MNNALSKIFIFAAGAAVGALATWKILETKYQQRIDEEVESVKAAYAQLNEKTDESDEETEEEDEEADPDGLRPDVKKYASILAKQSYTEEIIEEVDETDAPYVIPPEALGDCDYEIINLIYYADKVLTDEMNDPVEGADYLIGPDALNHFGEYEHDSVCVRNDKLKRDYEILLDEEKYSDVMKRV